MQGVLGPSPSLLPRNLPPELADLLKSASNESSLIQLLSKNPLLMMQFYVFAGEDLDWRKENQRLLGRVQEKANILKDGLQKLIASVDLVNQSILAEENPHVRRKHLCDAFLLMVVSRRSVYDYNVLYSDLAELKIPHDLKITALIEPFDSLSKIIEKRAAEIAPGLDTTRFSTINQSAQEASKVLQEKVRQSSQINAMLLDADLSILWNKLVGYMEQFQNGDFEFLVRDLRMLGLPEFLKDAAQIIKSSKNKNAQELEPYKQKFAEYEKTVKEKFYLYHALQTLCTPQKSSSTSRVSAPISVDRPRWNDTTPNSEDPAELWKALYLYIKERRPAKYEKIMKTLAPLPLPIHFKIRAISPDFDTLPETGHSPLFDLFCKNFRNLTPAERLNILKAVETARRDSTEQLTNSPPGLFLLDTPQTPSLLPSSNFSPAASLNGGSLLGNHPRVAPLLTSNIEPPPSTLPGSQSSSPSASSTAQPTSSSSSSSE